ncbi:hypothetical protein D3C80_962250 [compost metagenome]
MPDRVHPTLTVAECVQLIAGIERIVDAEIACGGVTVSSHGEVGAGALQNLVVGHTGRLTSEGLAFQIGFRRGDVGTERAVFAVQHAPKDRRAVTFGGGEAGVAGDEVCQATLIGALCNHRLAAIRQFASLADSRGIARGAFAQRTAHRRKRHGKMFFLSIGLSHCDVEVTTGACWVEVGDCEGTRRDGGFLNDEAVLADGDAGVSRGHTSDDRRITALRVRQHSIISCQVHTSGCYGVE